MSATIVKQYRVAPAPKFASMRSWDCTRCGREEVKPVFLTDGTTSLPYGSGCAARLLGLPQAARSVRDEYESIQRQADREEEMRDELRASAVRALAAFSEDPNREHPDLERMRRNYWTRKRTQDVPTFPAYIQWVTETGRP